MSAFLPSQVALFVPPLVGTMNESEVEHAAACIVRACQFHGDRWQPISAAQIGEVLRSDRATNAEPFAALTRNPFFRPDVWKLVEKGYGRWVDKSGGSCELTTDALNAIEKRWVRP